MTWKEKMVVRILMLVAQLLSPESWAKEVSSLATHLSVHIPEPK